MFSVCGVKNLVQGTNTICSVVVCSDRHVSVSSQGKRKLIGTLSARCADVLPVLHSEVNLRI